jgi:hypothetical protein
VIDDIVERTPAALDLVQSEIPASFPENIANSILGGIGKAAKRLS